MEGLPGDVIAVLLYKLAAQDPLSLVRATCALASFYHAAGETPSIWKAAFYGAAGEQVPEDIPSLEAEAEVLRGYETLVKTRLRICSSDGRCKSRIRLKKECNPLNAFDRSFESIMFSRSEF